jgi:aspartate/methionine/tyrosine aminotransferase
MFLCNLSLLFPSAALASFDLQSFFKHWRRSHYFDPVDFLFRYSIENVGGKAVPIPAGTSNVDFEEMEKLITIRTKMICLCNPLNPTGKVFSKMNLQLCL